LSIGAPELSAFAQGEPMSAFASLPLFLRRLWKRGSIPAPAGPVHVSMNDYIVHRAADVPAVWWAALRLRHAWPRTEGALGLWFCALDFRRSVSISIWRNPEELHGFVRSPAHLDIMRRHRNTGALTTIAWTSERFDPQLIWRQALERLPHPAAPGEPRPTGSPGTR
jgi:hypothetical protein